jgi:ADP-ribose pyrophosphatase
MLPEFMKIKGRETLYNGFFKVEKVSLEHQGELLERDIVINKDAVAALVFDTRKQEYILIEQFRAPAQKNVLEIVAGLQDKANENPETCITREIAEETGYAVDKLHFIQAFYSTPGSYSEKVWLYYAEVSRKISKGGGLAEEHEEIKTVSFSRQKLLAQPLEDAKTLIAVLWLQVQGAN